MKIVVLDFETYFDKEYTLRKLTTEEYIRDPRFEPLGFAISDSGGKPTWSRDFSELRALADCVVLCHHAQFDGLILSRHFGVRPKAWLDTLSMARMVIGNHLPVGLDSLAKHFGLNAKTVPYQYFQGRHWDQITSDVQQQLAEGCCHDVELTWQIFQRLAADFPTSEYALIDATIRMFTEPKLVGDRYQLTQIIYDEERQRDDLLREIEATRKDLGSNETFAALLRAEGVEPEMKPGKRGENYAFAKTDEFMRELLEDENPRVAALAQARLAEKSTISRTRAQRLASMALRGPLPVYLRYCGTHTTRWSGGDKTNFQNFRRNSPIAGAIQAPIGKKLVIADAGQIECRLLNYCAGQQDVIEDFRAGRDIYCRVASALYGREINKKDHPEQRQVGKVIELAAGYGMGAAKLQATLANAHVNLSAEEAQQGIHAYRSTHRYVVQYWKQAEQMLSILAAGAAREWGPFPIAGHRLYGPTGTWIDYSTLQWDGEAREWSIETRQGRVKIYGGKLVENAIQFLARTHIAEVWRRCIENGLWIVSMEHDKLIAIVDDVDNLPVQALAFLQAEMAREPRWLPGIPLASEGYISQSYAKE